MQRTSDVWCLAPLLAVLLVGCRTANAPAPAPSEPDQDPGATATATQRQASIHFQNGQRLRQQRRYREACGAFQQAYETLAASDPDYAKSRLANEYGLALMHIGEFGRAKAIIEEALQCSRSARDRTAEAVSLLNLGDACTRLGEVEVGKRHWTEALQIAHELKHPQLERSLLERLGVSGIHRWPTQPEGKMRLSPTRSR